ncbi:MAG TPA: threonine--tRNA ligase [Gemmatimonadota bacterium]|nr:threonine--tRNA ligase [Gemmatimonadota bacterium]
MNDMRVHIKDLAWGHVRAGATVGEALEQLGRDVAGHALAARVDGREVDLGCRLEPPAEAGGPVVEIEPILPDTLEGLGVLRHSTAHLLAAAVLDLFPGTKLGIGPALLDDPRFGFFYDVIAPRPLTDADLPAIEGRMRELAERGLAYRREELPKAEALRIFSERDEPLKCELIQDKGDERVSVYHIDDSPFVDFCLGPHVQSTDRLRAFRLLSLSGAYWKGDVERPQMQRIHGTAFATAAKLDAWLHQREETERRDHRRLGRELDLFSIQEAYGEGLILWHPKGGIVRKELEDYLRQQLLERGYGLVYTPHIARRELWWTSGHEENFADAMFSPMASHETEFRLKPMNCPFHIGIYRSAPRSYRDLPMRLAELGTVYRSELAGTLHGLLRVRGITQDDAHLFCTPESVRDEIVACLDFALDLYRVFGFEQYRVELSVRGTDSGKRYLGRDDDWNAAETALVAALAERDIPHRRMEGEAAFYGPKIDVQVEDAIGRPWQLTTVQFDFNLPDRFGLEYVGADGKPHRPIMIHRALFGSLERFFGVLIEHYAGAFPAWLAPVQVAVLTVADRVVPYAEGVLRSLRQAGLRVELNARGDTIGAKIREAQLQKIPFMLVLGDREAAAGTVSVRERSRGPRGAMPLGEFAEMALRLVRSRALVIA